MAWKKIDSIFERIKEKDLQEIFDAWHTTKKGCFVAGAPACLDIKVPNNRDSIAAFGYSFIPDVLWEAEKTYVIELKHSWKYEPIALAEVLHHAELLSGMSSSDREVIPVIVTSYSPWLRLAVKYLQDHGLERRSLTHLEVDFLEDPFSGQRILWFDDPLAPWEKATTVPGVMPETFMDGRASWYLVKETRTWFAVEKPLPNRPPIMDVPYVMLAPVAGLSNAYIIWHGVPPSRGETSRSWWKDSACYLWHEGVLREAVDLPCFFPAPPAE